MRKNRVFQSLERQRYRLGNGLRNLTLLFFSIEEIHPLLFLKLFTFT